MSDPDRFLTLKTVATLSQTKPLEHHHDVSFSNSFFRSTRHGIRDPLHLRRVSSQRVYPDGDRGRHCYPSPASSISSGHSSPQSSFSSSLFSSNASNSSSSRSPPSSQSSAVGFSAQDPIQTHRPQPRIQVSSLLADPHTRTYYLEVVQNPLRTAEFGMSNLSRLPLTPPIIVRLVVRDPSGNSVVPEGELPFLIAHLSLYSEDGSRSLDMGSQIGRENQAPILYGNLVSSVNQLEDLQGNMGLFFLFPDVSVRWRGRYQLGITLTKISSTDSSGSIGLADGGTHLCQTRTAAFEVLELSQYSASPPTRLTQAFIRQGARMLTYLP